ncbi:hypothetical protein [Blastococcus brunescens]|uniref:Uncharacterized protein n=1 Tax=Blastococcus brunescens TaxID=1564165 RepID=A0ABZ1AXU6_9ACTN|nr:hypothetical protein [Blastococcus sp. BMG 8361]WRL63390.1 hypothetical protein U6N30_27210 [Blastococcus sp. BMG 8361]
MSQPVRGDHAFGAFPRPRAEGTLGHMEATQREVRVSDDPTEAQTEESHTPEPAAVSVARMLANPRRIRRN